MNFLNLSPAEFFVLLGSASAIITALYLLDRNKKRRVVSTLRFWNGSARAEEQKNRKRVRDPWSLLLQLLALLCLCLAIAQLHWGGQQRPLRNHVLLLDTSAASVLPQEKSLARQYLRRLPATDRVMVVEADGLLTPMTAFTSDRAELEQRIRQATASFSALNLDHALQFANQALTWPAGEPGEIVYDGPGRLAQPVAGDLGSLRILPVVSKAQPVSIAGLSARPGANPREWEATVSVKNETAANEDVQLWVRFGMSSFAPRALRLLPGEERQSGYSFLTNSSGELRAALQQTSSNSDAVLHLPVNRPLRVAVFTARPDSLKLLLGANRRWAVQYLVPSQYSAGVSADLVVLDQFAPKNPPEHATLYLHPPRETSPLPLRTTERNQLVTAWNADGLHATDVRLPESNVYETFATDTAVASVAAGPVAVVRTETDGLKRAVIGFDPVAGALRYDVTSALLVAQMLRWLGPAAFEVPEISCRPVGLVTLPVEQPEQESVRVIGETGQVLPFTVHNERLQFYMQKPGTARVVSRQRERMVSLTLPQAAPFEWKPRHAAIGLPAGARAMVTRVELWRTLAGLGGILLLTEWLLFAHTPGRLRTVLKMSGMAAIVAALFIPGLRMPTARTGAVVLVDTSASIGTDAIARASRLVKQLAQERGHNWMSVVPFDSRPRPTEANGERIGLPFVPVSNRTEANSTDLEAALTESVAAIPEGYVPRILLLSDGNENQGSTARAIAELRHVHVPVDTVPLTGRSLTAVTISSVAMPSEVYAGEKIPVTVTVEAPAAVQASLSLTAEGKALGTQPVSLYRGSNVVRAEARLKSSGSAVISGILSAADLGTARFSQPVELKHARALYISQDPAGTEGNLVSLLKTDQFTVETDAALLNKPLRDFQLLILNNVDLNAMASRQKEEVERYVAAGGGLLLIGGEHQIYKEDKQADALDRVLPAKLAPPRSPEGICVALIIDKSSSMEGRKIELARLSAIGVVDHLRDKDTIGVLMFDNSYSWAVPMRKATDKKTIKRLISGIMPDGGTQIAPALAEAYRKVVRTTSAYKHVVLLTDGISEEGDSLELAREAQAHQVTISTVGLGQDVNRPYLEKVSNMSGGRSYFLNNPQGLEQILLKDVQDYTGSTAVEKPLVPMVMEKAEVLDGVDFAHAPALKGYARFEAKPDSQTLLSIDPEKHDPLLVRWQYGLGRAAVFTSDAKSRWAEQWMTWPGFDKFWTNVVRDLVSHGNETEATATYDAADNALKVHYRLAPGVPEPARVPSVFVLGPGGLAERLSLRRLAAGVYEGELQIKADLGLYRVRPLEDSWLFPEIGFYRANEELRDRGVNEALLRELSAFTGGEFDAAPERVFASDGRVAYVRTDLWPAVLGLAIVLTLAELVARKWRALRSFRFAASPAANNS